jgi:hypothetical protein
MVDKENMPNEFEQGVEVNLDQGTNPFAAAHFLRFLKSVARDADKEMPTPGGRGR